MANVMKMADLKNHASRNGFDLSNKNAFTAKIGEILPIGAIHTLPGDKFKINISNFTRTMPVNTAAYTRIREYIDAWFVPYRLLWKNFDNFSTNMLHNQQHASSITTAEIVTEQHPYFTVKDIADYIVALRSESTPINNKFGYDRADLTCKLMEYLDYGDFSEYDRDATWTEKPRFNFDLNPFALLAYQKIYQDHIRNEQWETSQPWSYNLDYMTNANMHISIADLIADIKGGLRSNMFDLRYCNWEKDYYFGVLPDSQYGDESVVPMKTLATDRVTDSGHYLEGLKVINNTDIARFNDPISAGDSNNNLYKMSSYRQPDVYRDLNLSLPEGMVNKINAYVNDLSILRLRQAEYLQKWKEIAQSGDQDFKTQVEKFWNVNIPKTLSNLCTHLGGSVTNLDITEVVNTNITGSNAADIAGQGRGAGSGFVEFDSNDFGNEYGVILFTYHARPLLDYATNGINRFNLKTRYADYANPAFDKLGMQETYMAEIDNSSKLYSLNTSGDLTDAFIGYAPRYAEYKTNIDKIHGGFNHDKTLGTWVAPITTEYFEKFLQSSRESSFLGINYNLFKVNPNILDPIFVANADSTTLTDQLLINAGFDIKAVRNLDYNGLPY